MSAKFRYGDKVMAGNHRGTIISVTLVDGKYLCKVRFDNKDLIPHEMSYYEKYLSFAETNEEVCPICRTRWSITKFNMHVWKDCKKCGKTSEDCIKIHEDTKRRPGFGFSKSGQELLREFENMLDNKIEDDDDDADNDFFLYGF